MFWSPTVSSTSRQLSGCSPDQPPFSLCSCLSCDHPHLPLPHHHVLSHTDKRHHVMSTLVSQDPLFLDLIGTCHSDNTKPAILKPQHLTWYRTHLARGLTLYPPDILAAMLKEKRLEPDENGALMLPAAVCAVPDLPAPREAGCSFQVPGPFPGRH